MGQVYRQLGHALSCVELANRSAYPMWMQIACHRWHPACIIYFRELADRGSGRIHPNRVNFAQRCYATTTWLAGSSDSRSERPMGATDLGPCRTPGPARRP